MLKKKLRYNLFNYCTTIDIGEGIPHDLGKKEKRIFLLHLNEFNLKDGLKNYIVAKIFYAPSNEKKKGMEEKKNPICYIKSFCCTIPKLNIYIYIYIKTFTKNYPIIEI